MSNQKTISIFFDGTGNNGFNTLTKPKKIVFKKSYKLAPTNIFRLYANLKLQDNDQNKSFYIEGIGTITDHPDNPFSKGTGEDTLGLYGYGATAKLEQAKYEFDKYVSSFRGEETELIINLFGYSRGAALARIFAKKIKIHAEQYKPITLKFNFIGLFDTVASFHTKQLIPQDLRLNEIGFKTVFQIAAGHEARHYFPLTSILNETVSDKIDIYNEYAIFNQETSMEEEENIKLVSKNIELYVPGSHTNIGGGNKNLKKIKFIINSDDRKILHEKKLWKELIESKKITSLLPKNTYLSKNLSNKLQFVNLFTMINAAKKESLNFDIEKVADNLQLTKNKNYTNSNNTELDEEFSENDYNDINYSSEDLILELDKIDEIFKKKITDINGYQDNESLYEFKEEEIKKLGKELIDLNNDCLKTLLQKQIKCYDDIYSKNDFNKDSLEINHQLHKDLFDKYIYTSSNILIEKIEKINSNEINSNEVHIFLPSEANTNWKRGIFFK